MSAGITANNDGSASITVGGIPAIEISAAGGVTIPDLTSGGVPSGAVFYFAASTAPTGYLEANGAAVSRATYAALFAVVGTTYGAGNGTTTFNLPNLRGQFLRGWDNGAGVDPARVFGSSQAQATEAHQHIMPISWNTGNGDMLLPNSYLYGSSGSFTRTAVNGSTTAQSAAATAPLVSTQIGTTSGETRPTNVALLPCIKT